MQVCGIVRPLVQRTGQDFVDPGSADMGSMPIADLKVRLISTNDVGRHARESWAQQVFADVETFPFDDEDTSCLSLAFSDYDVLLVSGQDNVRMARFIRNNRKIINRKLKLCLMGETHPRRRAAALIAGFDDVFDTTRMHPAEAIGRIRAIQRRYHETRAEEERATAEIERITQIADPRYLTRREAQIIAILLDSPRHFARYETILARLSGPSRAASRNGLKVAICMLRPKLRAGVAISALQGIGYQMVFSNDLIAAQVTADAQSTHGESAMTDLNARRA